MNIKKYFDELTKNQKDIIDNIEYIASSASCLTRVYDKNYGNFLLSHSDYYIRYFDAEDIYNVTVSILDSIDPTYKKYFDEMLKCSAKANFNGNIENIIVLINLFMGYMLKDKTGLEKEIQMKSYELYAINKMAINPNYTHDANLYLKKMLETTMLHAKKIVGIASHLDMYNKYRSISSFTNERYNNESLFGLYPVDGAREIEKYAYEVMVLSMAMSSYDNLMNPNFNMINSANHFQKVMHHLNGSILPYRIK